MSKERDRWYRVLADAGFKDIETRDETGEMNGPLKTDKRWNADKRLSFEDVAAGYESEAEYYRLAGLFLHEHRFPVKEDRSIWELHAEGVPYREIATRLGIETHMRVHYVVNDLRDRMMERFGVVKPPGNAGKSVKAPVSNNGARSMVISGEGAAPGTGPETLLQDILGIIQEQVVVLRTRSTTVGGPALLGIDETRALCEYGRVVLAVSKDRRQADDEDLGGLTRPELMARLEKYVGKQAAK